MHRASGLRSQYHVLLLAPLAILIVLALIFGRSLLGSSTPGSATFTSEPMASGADKAAPAPTASSSTRQHLVPPSPTAAATVAPTVTPAVSTVRDLGVVKGVLKLKGPSQATKGDVVVFVLNGARHVVRTVSSMPFATSLNVAALPNGKYTVAVLWMHKGAGTSVASTSTVMVKNVKAAAATASGSGSSTASGAGDAALSATYIAQVLSITNTDRAKAGCDPLTPNSLLTEAAQDHTSDMAEKTYFSHDGKDGSSPFDRMKAVGYTFSAAGENIAMGQQTAHIVMKAWMNSPGHRANILNCTYTQIGVGYAVDKTGAPYWTQDFGKPL